MNNNRFMISLIVYSILGLIFAWAAVDQASDKFHHDFGILAKCLMYIPAAIVSVLGGFLGAKIRDIIKPDFIDAYSYMELLKKHFLWFALPPLIGCILGASAGRLLVIYPMKWIMGF